MNESAEKALHSFLERANNLLERLDYLLPASTSRPDWNEVTAARWQADGRSHRWQAIEQPDPIQLDDLLCIDRQKSIAVTNTEQFVTGAPSNHLLLTGSRGTGKSTLIKALLNTYADEGLRLIEVNKQGLASLPDISALIADLPQRFIIYCDDLSFTAEEAGYQTLKALLDGSVAATPANLLIYATSNRRHLLPEYQRDNDDSRIERGEIHHGEAVEEKISLSDRFGLWLSFHPFSQDEYLTIVEHWLAKQSISMNPETRQQALRWALQRGARSGRVARQFANDHAGRQILAASEKR